MWGKEECAGLASQGGGKQIKKKGGEEKKRGRGQGIGRETWGQEKQREGIEKRKGEAKKMQGEKRKGEKKRKGHEKKEKQIKIKKRKSGGKGKKGEKRGEGGGKALLSSCWSTLQVPQGACDLAVPRDGDTHSHRDKQLQPLTRQSKTSFYFQMLQF